MVDLKKLDELYKSETIKPTFDYVHILLALIIFGKNEGKGLGRYRLKNELLIGPGTARSLISKLNENIEFIKVLNEENKRKGHILTERGEQFLNEVKEQLPVIKHGNIEYLKDLIVQAETVNIYLILVRDAAKRLGTGIEQRDAAIKVDGLGATCLIYDGGKFHYPYKAGQDTQNKKIYVKQEIQEYLKKEVLDEEQRFMEYDVIILGLGDNNKKARLAALNAALTLITKK
jgi:hypothetical protein